MQKIKLVPELPNYKEKFQAFLETTAQETNIDPLASRTEALKEIKKKLISEMSLPLYEEELAFLFAKSLLLDLLFQGWTIQFEQGLPWLTMNSQWIDNQQNVKAQVRAKHELTRDAQLQTKSVCDFIYQMEVRRHTATGWHSVYSLMRDGSELADQLEKVRKINSQEDKNNVLQKIIKPYLQFVEPDTICSHTGFKLTDIWRYFRHTWVNEYKSVPGRSVMILVRDASAKNHPVIGIAALGSSMVQHAKRDAWIGWDRESIIERCKHNPSKKLIRWIFRTWDDLFSRIYRDDLITENILKQQEIVHPTPAVVTRLKTIANEYRQLHARFPDKAKNKSSGEVNWQKQAKTFLFKSKRCLALADFLSIREVFQKYDFKRNSSSGDLSLLVEKAHFRDALSRFVRRAKAEKVGINIMDIMVCGAIAPYNHILGGKLICMLLCSPEVTKYCYKKYSNQVSIIASSIKGEKVIKKPEVVLLGTTSLYGIGSSQYNRIKIPAQWVGGQPNSKVEYKKLGYSEGFGSFHFSRETIELGDRLVGRRRGGKRVNSIFGEGANPLLRKIREAIESIGLESDPILNHGNRRVVYGISLIHNYEDYLIGLAKKPNYIFLQNKPLHRTKQITDYWLNRWFSMRIMNEEILKRVSQETLSYPIIHGARVSCSQSEKTDIITELIARQVS